MLYSILIREQGEESPGRKKGKVTSKIKPRLSRHLVPFCSSFSRSGGFYSATGVRRRHNIGYRFFLHHRHRSRCDTSHPLPPAIHSNNNTTPPCVIINIIIRGVFFPLLFQCVSFVPPFVFWGRVCLFVGGDARATFRAAAMWDIGELRQAASAAQWVGALLTPRPLEKDGGRGERVVKRGPGIKTFVEKA